MTTLEEAMAQIDAHIKWTEDCGLNDVMVSIDTLRTLLSALRSRPTREDVARVISQEFYRQEYGDPSAPSWTPWSDETPMWWPYVDQGPVDLGQVADAVLALFEGGK
jgi:hypothetical protein